MDKARAKATQIAGRTVIAFTFRAGGYWNFLGNPLPAKAIADDEPTNKEVYVGIEGVGRNGRWFVPAAVILDNGRLYDNVLCEFDEQLGPEFSAKEKLLNLIEKIKERITNEYPGPRRGTEGL